MSTRGVIARWQGEGPSFEGRYHHWDSYPSGLGRTLFRLAREKGVENLLHILIDEHPAGWSTIVAKDFDLEPGFVEDLSSSTQQPLCYCHGDRAERPQLLTEKTAASVGCEWGYAFEGNQMHIFFYGSKVNLWKEVAIVDLDGPEPVWNEI